MNGLRGKSALVIGASSGVGRATLLALASRGMRVCGVARSRERIDRIAREAPGHVTALAEDASAPDAAARLLRGAPDLVVVCVGARPRMAPVDEHTWETFSAAWNIDVQVTFHLCQEALRLPLRAGSVVVIVSSGAASAGSPLSFGYAGQKRMQRLVAAHMQRASDARRLGIRFVAIVPKQFIVGTTIAELGSRAYADEAGISQERFMERFGPQLMPEAVAEAIVRIARGEAGAGSADVGVTGRGIEEGN